MRRNVTFESLGPSDDVGDLDYLKERLRHLKSLQEYLKVWTDSPESPRGVANLAGAMKVIDRLHELYEASDAFSHHHMWRLQDVTKPSRHMFTVFESGGAGHVNYGLGRRVETMLRGVAELVEEATWCVEWAESEDT